MAKTRDYMDYLDNEIGIAPANSQEEFQAAETLVEIMKDHGLEPTIQEFDTHPLGKLMPDVLAIVLLLGVLLTGVAGGAVRAVGLVLALAAGVLLVMVHRGNNVFENFGPVERSQNVVGVHRATGDKVTKGSRPIVIVAHYDTPRENYLYGNAFARYQSTLYKASFPCVLVAALMALTQVFGFLPVAVRVLLWVVGLVACIPLVVVAIANIMERFAACTSGSNDNKASVAAMLSVLAKVRPGADRVDAAAEGRPYVRRASEDQKPRMVQVVEKPSGVRHGKEVLESLGILPPTCQIVYEEPKVVTVPADQAVDGALYERVEPEYAGAPDEAQDLSPQEPAAQGQQVETAEQPEADASAEDVQAYDEQAPADQANQTAADQTYADASATDATAYDQSYDANADQADQQAYYDEQHYSDGQVYDDYSQAQEDDAQAVPAADDQEQPSQTTDQDDSSYQPTPDEYYEDQAYDEQSTQEAAESPSDLEATQDLNENPAVRLNAEASAKSAASSAAQKAKKKGMGFFHKLKEKFSRVGKPVIARGENKDLQGADYSSFETTYKGDEDVEAWRADDGSELRTVRPGDLRPRRVSDDADAAQQGSAADNYYQDAVYAGASDEYYEDEYPATDGYADESGQEYDDYDEGYGDDGAAAEEPTQQTEDSSATDAAQKQAPAYDEDRERDNTEIAASDQDESEEDLEYAPQADEQDASVEARPAAGASDPVAASDTGSSMQNDAAADSQTSEDNMQDEGAQVSEDDQPWDVTPSEAPKDDFASEGELAANPKDDAEDQTPAQDKGQGVPEPVRLDTLESPRRQAARRRNVAAASSNRSSSKDAPVEPATSGAQPAKPVPHLVDTDVTATGQTDDDQSAQQAASDLSWDQSSVEDEEYAQETVDDSTSDGEPADADYQSGEEYYESDEAYDSQADDQGYSDDAYADYDRMSGQSQDEWSDDGSYGDYDEGQVSPRDNGTKGHGFLDRLKGWFSGYKSGHGDQADPAAVSSYDEYYDDASDQQAAQYDADNQPDNADASRDDGSQQEDAYTDEREYDNSTADDGERAQRRPEQGAAGEFEEVRGEDYLPSDADALDDLDADYDFDQPNDAPTADDDYDLDQRGSYLQFDDDEESSDILPKDTSGLDTISEGYEPAVSSAHGYPRRKAPKPIDDPSWGKSSYEPPINTSGIARRAALCDLPDPSGKEEDPLAEGAEYDDYDEAEPYDYENDDTAGEDTEGMDVSDDQRGNRRMNWKGGAAVRSDLRDPDVQQPTDEPAQEMPANATADQMADDAVQDEAQDVPDDEDAQDAILQMGDDYLVSHDVWFVAVGASSVGHAGIKSFLANFRRDIRGAFLVNLDSIGAGAPVVLTREGRDDGRRADRRSLRLFTKTAQDLHLDLQTIDYGWTDTDATPAMRSRVRSFTVMGMDENGLPALSHTMNDAPVNVDPGQVSSIVRAICEFIRRS